MLEKGVEGLIRRSRHASRLREHLVASHTATQDVARIARDSGCSHLVLNHLVPVDDPDINDSDWIESMSGIWDGKVTLGYDGLEIERANL